MPSVGHGAPVTGRVAGGVAGVRAEIASSLAGDKKIRRTSHLSAVRNVIVATEAASEYSRRSLEGRERCAWRRNNTEPRCEDGRRRVGRGPRCPQEEPLLARAAEITHPKTRVISEDGLPWVAAAGVAIKNNYLGSRFRRLRGAADGERGRK